MQTVAKESSGRPRLTLGLCALLHAFTHAMAVLLVPLYLLIVHDLGLPGVRSAALIVTVYTVVYCLGAWHAGVLADRWDRKWLLGIGLLGNSVAILGMGLTRQYEMLIALGAIGGLFGSLFHPCANALVPAHFPRNPGMAIGLLGIGSGLGFYAGPRFAGWRASRPAWELPNLATWQRPCVEMGVIGLIAAVVFLILAHEAPHRHAGTSADELGSEADGGGDAVLPARASVEAIVTDLRATPAATEPILAPRLRRLVWGIAALLGWRDFAGVASLSLASIYLQRALHYSTDRVGIVVGGMMLIGVLANPLFVYFSHGRRRLPTLAITLLLGGIALALVPWLPAAWVIVPLSTFQFFQLGGYSISDAASWGSFSPRPGPSRRLRPF
jgi:MFS family permease